MDLDLPTTGTMSSNPDRGSKVCMDLDLPTARIMSSNPAVDVDVCTRSSVLCLFNDAVFTVYVIRRRMEDYVD